MTRTKVLISGHLHDSAIAGFRANGAFDVTYVPDCPKEELMRLLPGTNVLVTRSETDVDKTLIEMAPDLKVIARRGGQDGGG